jgi:hypothetical protein
MTGSAVASLAIIAAPHLEMPLRGVFHGRDKRAQAPYGAHRD